MFTFLNSLPYYGTRQRLDYIEKIDHKSLPTKYILYFTIKPATKSCFMHVTNWIYLAQV